MKFDEHLYIFSERSIKEIFRRIGAEYIYLERAIFAQYDMFFAVSRVPLKTNSSVEIESVLLSKSNGRFALALLDLRERELSLIFKHEESEADRAARAKQIEALTGMLRESEVGPCGACETNRGADGNASGIGG